MSSADLRNTWTLLSKQCTKEYEQCIASIVSIEKAENFDYEGLCKALDLLSNFEKKANDRVIESGVLKGVNVEDVKKAYCTIDGVTTDVLISGIPVQNRVFMSLGLISWSGLQPFLFMEHLMVKAAGMGFDQSKNREIGEQSRAATEENDTVTGDRDLDRLGRQMSEASLCATEEEEEEEVEEGKKFDLGPQYTIKEQLEKDKDDESLRRWKEQLLGSVDLNNVGESLEPEVKISLAILSPGRPDLLLPVPAGGKPKGPWFTLKEGSRYRLKFTFQVCGNIVSGLKYTNSVWKAGVRVYNTKEMLGTFSPQDEPYVYEMPEETTPSGIFVRGSYTSRSKFIDDDNKCYLEINYTFDIRKEWATP